MRLNKRCATFWFVLIQLFTFNTGAQAQEFCENSKLENGLDIKIACLIVGDSVYTLTLTNVDPIGLTWQFSGVTSTPSCKTDLVRCTNVAPNLALTINSLDINNETFQVELAHAPELGDFFWRYAGHTASQGDNSPLLDAAALEQIRSFMNAAVQNQAKIPGAVLALAQGNSTIFMEAFGVSDVSSGKKLAINDLLHIGSTNKAITSFLIARLIDDGILQWDTKAIDIYPNFSTSDSAASNSITIRQLLDMTSGLPRDADIDTSEPARALFDQLSQQTMIAAPGTQYQYSNLSSSLAAYLGVLASVKASNGVITSGDLDNLQSGYAQLLQEKVLNPLGMSDSTLSANVAIATGRLSKSHALVNNSFQVSQSIDVDLDNIAPAGGLKSTIGDVLRYTITDMQQGLTPEGQRVASATNTLARQKLSPGPASEMKYGISMEVVKLENGVDYVGHSGSFDNFNSILGFFPKYNLAFAFISNGDSPAALDLTGNEENSIVELLSQLLIN